MTRREVIELILKMKGGQEASKQVDRVSSSFRGLKTVALGIGGAFAGLSVGVLVERLLRSVEAAGDFHESLSKVQTLFGPGKGREISSWASTAADAMGLSSQAALDAVGSIGNMFLQLKAGQQQAASLSLGLVQLSSDLASFHNAAGGANEVLGAMQSAFRGEYDALQRYIPTINAAAVQEQALADTHKHNAKELTALDKALAAHKIILRDAGAAVGDFERTADEYANTSRRLDSVWKDFSATLGEKFLPAATKIKGVTADILKNLTEAIKDSGIDAQIAEAQAAYDKLILERDHREEVLARKRREREERHQKMVESFARRNAGPINSESARILKEFQTRQAKDLQLAPGELDIKYAKEYLDKLKALKKEREAAEAAKDRDKKTPPPDGDTKKVASEADKIEARIKRLNAWTDTQVANLESLWDQGLVSLQDYFNQRYNLITKQYQEELENLKKLAAVEGDPDKKLAIQTEIYERQQKYEQDLIDLAKQRTQAYDELAEKQQEINDLIEAARDRAQDAEKPRDRAPYNLFGDIDDANERYDTDIADMESRHEEELEALEELYDGRKEMAEEHAEYIRDLDNLSAAHSREKEAEKLNHEKKIAKLRIKLAAKTAGLLADTMYNLYVATGESNKMLLELYKTAAIAQTIINTAAAIMDVWAHPGMSPYEKIGWTVYVTALGAAQIATISAQKLAYGGTVGGHSPNDRADNVPIMATAGEYMIQRPSAGYYGRRIMDAINNAMIPRGVLENIISGTNVPSFQPAYALASGGPVPAAAATGSTVIGDVHMTVQAQDAQSFADNPEMVADAFKQAVRLGMLRGTLS